MVVMLTGLYEQLHLHSYQVSLSLCKVLGGSAHCSCFGGYVRHVAV